jgi:hypothetical protein
MADHLDAQWILRGARQHAAQHEIAYGQRHEHEYREAERAGDHDARFMIARRLPGRVPHGFPTRECKNQKSDHDNVHHDADGHEHPPELPNVRSHRAGRIKRGVLEAHGQLLRRRLR